MYFHMNNGDYFQSLIFFINSDLYEIDDSKTQHSSDSSARASGIRINVSLCQAWHIHNLFVNWEDCIKALPFKDEITFSW